MRKILRTPEYLEELRQRRIVSKRKWVANNKEAMQQCRDNWKRNNPDRILQKRRERTERLSGRKVIPRRSVSRGEKQAKARKRSNRWYHANKHKIKRQKSRITKVVLTLVQKQAKLEWQKLWRAKNPDKMRAYSLKQRDNPQLVIKQRLCSRIVKCLKRKKIRKSAHTIELIGCTWDFLKFHLESQFVDGMSWEKRSLWHIDHVKPCARFDLTDPAEQRACFHYTNLQPLWAIENMRKHAKWQEAA